MTRKAFWDNHNVQWLNDLKKLKKIIPDFGLKKNTYQNETLRKVLKRFWKFKTRLKY